MNRSSFIIAMLAILLPGLTACAGHDDPPPPPNSFDQSFVIQEDDSLSSTLDADDLDVDSSRFIILEGPLDGTLELDPDTGDFTYFPDPGFLGSDSFSWEVEDRFGQSGSADVEIDVEPDAI